MSLSILTIGVGGIVALQKVTLTSSQHARNLSIATQISQAWIDQLRADAVVWNHPSTRQPTTSDLADTDWLDAMVGVAGTSTAWFRPAWQGARLFGPGFDVQGRPVDTSVVANAAQVRFCTHLRLSWLHRDVGSNVTEQRGSMGNGLIRAEVRVFWVRDAQSAHTPGDVCGGATPVGTIGTATDRYHFVYQVSAIRQNTAPQ
jgi:hypothetical protein